MDLQTLSNLFGTTYNPDPNVRKAAELQIRKIGGQEGMIAALLQIIATDSVDLATRQSCAVYIKNRVSSSYFIADSSAPRASQIPIAPSDREALKSSILHLLATSPSRSITGQLSATLKILVSNDFPDTWPGLLDTVKAMLGSSEIREVGAGCVATLEVVRAFRFRQKEDLMPQVVSELFPILATIATNMLSTPPTASPEIPTMLHLILKSYKTSIILHLSKHQQSAESIVPWGRLFFQLVNLQLPKEAVPEDEDERERCEWWKAKKWAYATLGRLFHRFGNPSQLPSPLQDQYGAFAQHFATTFAPEIFKVYIHQVELFVSGQVWLSKKCQYHIFAFFTECVKPKATWHMLKPHFETLVSTFVFPQMSFNPIKQELWETDPVDYVRISVDEYENFASPVSAATTFLLALAGSRTKVAFMPIITFITSVLRSNAAPAQRFGALNMTAALGPFIMNHPQVKEEMEQFMMQHVYPEFTAPEPYLRAIACEVLGTVEKCQMTWSSEENINQHFRAVAACMDDPELPVRVQAVLALTELVTVHEPIRKAVAPSVEKVILDLLKLCDETDLDILNNSMEIMVQHFQTEVLPVAAQLTGRLCESYMRLARDAASSEEVDPTASLEAAMENTPEEDKVYAAMGVAKTIGTIVSAVDSAPEILAQVQEVIVPIIQFTLENKMIDLFDNMYDLIDSLTFKLQRISPTMWPIYELTYKLFKADAVDFLEEMLPALDNFVSYGTDAFKSRADYRDMVLDIYSTCMGSDQLGENDRVNGCKLAESILLNLRGHIDDKLQTIITTALEHMPKAESAALRLANLEVLINAVLYNPAGALHIMEMQQAGISRVFFDKWFAAINDGKLPRVHDKRLSIVALCSLMEMAPSAIPDVLKDGWPGVVAGALKLFQEFPKAVADRKAIEEAYHEDVEDDFLVDDETKYLNMNEEEEDVWDEDSAYLEMLAKEGARLREKSEKRTEGQEVEDDSDEEDSDIEEELGYISPLDKVNPYVTFKQALTTFQMQNALSYQAATTSLNVEQQTALMEVMRIAEQPESAATA